MCEVKEFYDPTCDCCVTTVKATEGKEPILPDPDWDLDINKPPQPGRRKKNKKRTKKNKKKERRKKKERKKGGNKTLKKKRKIYRLTKSS